jgi:hypothetical protein
MLAIAHFAVGVCGALVLLIFFPGALHQYIPNLIKNDVFFLFGSGLFAMLPDINHVVNSGSIKFLLDKIHESPLMNIFWGHYSLDRLETSANTIIFSVIVIASAIILFLIYSKKI